PTEAHGSFLSVWTGRGPQYLGSALPGVNSIKGGTIVQRRSFLASSFAASALAVNASSPSLRGGQAATSGEGRDYYELRRYQLFRGPQVKLADDFFREALVPAL